MAMKLYNDSSIQAIADAIRAKNGENTNYTVSEMAAAILAISSGGGDGSISARGTYTPTGDITTSITIAHNLGSVPDIVLFWMNESWTQSISAMVACGCFTKAASTPTYSSWFVRKSSTTNPYISFQGSVTSYGMPTRPTASELYVQGNSTYPIKGNKTYSWLAIKL